MVFRFFAFIVIVPIIMEYLEKREWMKVSVFVVSISLLSHNMEYLFPFQLILNFYAVVLHEG